MEKIEQEFQDQLHNTSQVQHLHTHIEASMKEKLKEAMIFGKMVVLHYRMFGGQDDHIYKAAAAVELWVLALDVIDDIQDRDHHAMYWNQVAPEIALNIALGLIVLSQDKLRNSFPDGTSIKALDVMNRHFIEAINGQTLDLLNEINCEAEYIGMVRQKSASLLVSACQIGVMLAKGQTINIVTDYAQELGIASQIKNDIRDLLNWEQKNDILHRKMTLPVLYLLESLSKEDQWIQDYFDGKLDISLLKQKKQDFEKAVQRTGTIVYSTVRMKSHYYRYLELVDGLSIHDQWKKKLQEILKY